MSRAANRRQTPLRGPFRPDRRGGSHFGLRSRCAGTALCRARARVRKRHCLRWRRATTLQSRRRGRRLQRAVRATRPLPPAPFRRCPPPRPEPAGPASAAARPACRRRKTRPPWPSCTSPGCTCARAPRCHGKGGRASSRAPHANETTARDGNPSIGGDGQIPCGGWGENERARWSLPEWRARRLTTATPRRSKRRAHDVSSKRWGKHAHDSLALPDGRRGDGTRTRDVSSRAVSSGGGGGGGGGGGRRAGEGGRRARACGAVPPPPPMCSPRCCARFPLPSRSSHLGTISRRRISLSSSASSSRRRAAAHARSAPS